MLQFRRSRLRQSKPSIRTGAGLCPNFIRTHAPPLRADEEDGEGGAGENEVTFSLPKCSSWITGFEALLGGDPQKYGGDEATWLQDLSPQFPLVRIISRRSVRGGLGESPPISGWWHLEVGLKWWLVS